jgi:hypothetical protein
MAGRTDGPDRAATRGRSHAVARVVAAAALAVLAVLLWGGYVRHWAWTGFGANDTLWDWLNLIVLPVVLVFVGPWTDVAARVRDNPRRHVIALAAAAFVALAVAGYTIPILWTGFAGDTLWDWLHLWLLPLLVPTVLGPALLRWIAVEEAKPVTATEGAPAARARARRGLVASLAAAGILALSLGVAVGAAALGGDSGTGPAASRASGPCTAPGARTVAADGAGRVVRAGPSLFACRPGGGAQRLGAASGAARPIALRLAAGRVAYAVQDCAAGSCSVAVRVLRLSDGRAFVRARFARSAPVAGLTVSPRGALAVMLAGRCRGCSPARVVLIDALGSRVADSGPALDAGSLAEAGTTVFWRHGGRAASARLSG